MKILQQIALEYFIERNRFSSTVYHKNMSRRYMKVGRQKQRSLVAEYEAGAKAKDLSERNHIPLSSLYSWINKYKKVTKRKESKNQITTMDYVRLKRSRDKYASELEILQLKHKYGEKKLAPTRTR